MKELFRKRVGKYYLGRTLGEVRTVPGASGKSGQYFCMVLPECPEQDCWLIVTPSWPCAGHLCEGQVWAACGHWGGRRREGE